MVMSVTALVVVLMRMVFMVMAVFVSVVPQLCLVEQKEEHQPEQQGHEQHVGRDV